MPAKGKKTRCEGTWTDGEWRAWIAGVLSSGWIKYPVREMAYQYWRRPYSGPNKRQKWEWPCQGCERFFRRDQIHMDHITPRGSPFEGSFLEYCERTFCELKNLQPLCKDCHKVKSSKETTERAVVRRAKKKREQKE